MSRSKPIEQWLVWLYVGRRQNPPVSGETITIAGSVTVGYSPWPFPEDLDLDGGADPSAISPSGPR